MRYRQGYIALITVLIISAVSLVIAATVVLLGIGVGQSALSGSKGENALEFAEGCAEDGLLKTQQSSSYSGGNITRPEGTCFITVQKSGNNWTIIATGSQSDYNRTVQVQIVRSSGSPITLSSWQESLPVPTPTPTPTPINTPTPTPTLIPTPTPTLPAQPVALGDYTTGGSAGATSDTHALTVTSHPNMYLVAFVATSGQTVTSMTDNGSSMTKLTAIPCASGCNTEAWYFKNPSTGTNTLSYSFSGSAHYVIGIETVYNVNQSTPFGTPVTATQTSSSISMNVSTTSSNQLVISGVGSIGTSPAWTTSGTQSFNGGATTITASGAYQPAVNGTTNLTWTIPSTTWSAIAVALNP